MPLGVFLLVLLGAALHASWNAIVKGAGDKLLTMILVGASAAALAGAALPFLPPPAPGSRPFIAASVLLQVVYFVLVVRAYDAADLSLAYPVMRGSAPLLVALAGRAAIGERLSPAAWLGTGAVCLGILCMAAGSRREHRRGLTFALLNALVIAAYTLVDGMGVRRSGAPAAYTLWIFLLTGVPLAAWACVWKREALTRCAARGWPYGLVGGAGAVASYGLALWAMTRAPVAVVAALRETSILFGIAISGLWLKERPGPVRLAAAGIITLGAAVLRLA